LHVSTVDLWITKDGDYLKSPMYSLRVKFADSRFNQKPKLAPPSLGAPVPLPPAQKKIHNDTQVDSEQAALVNVMKAAIAARHGGVLPKTLSDEDAKAASQAAIKWQAKH
jgi:hypothetical protein